MIRQALDTTAKLSAFVLFILLGARVFSLTFYGVNGHLWVEHLLTSVPGRRHRLPDRRQPPGLRAGLLPRLSSSWPSSSCRCWAPVAARPGHRPDLVRRAAGGQHADLVHASALRLLAVLPALGGADAALSRQGHRPHHRAGDDRADLPRRDPLRGDPGPDGRDRDRLPGVGDALQVGPGRGRSATINVDVPMPGVDGGQPVRTPPRPIRRPPPPDFGAPPAPGGQPAPAPAQPGDPLPAPDFK